MGWGLYSCNFVVFSRPDGPNDPASESHTAVFYETWVASFLMTNTNPPDAGGEPGWSIEASAGKRAAPYPVSGDATIAVIGEGRTIEERGRTLPTS